MTVYDAMHERSILEGELGRSVFKRASKEEYIPMLMLMLMQLAGILKHRSTLPCFPNELVYRSQF